MAYEGGKPFLGLYLVEAVGVAESNAALAQGIAGISGVIMAIPARYLAHRIGRRGIPSPMLWQMADSATMGIYAGL